MLLASFALAAESAPIVFPARAVNLSPGEVRAAETLFRGWFERTTGLTAYGDEATRALPGATGDDAALQAACKSIDCERYLVMELVRLENDIIVRVVDRGGSGVVRADLEAVADDLNDLHPLFDRVSRSLVAGAPIDATITRHNVLASETQPPRRLSAEKLTGFRFGVLSDLYGSAGVTTGFAMRWEMDHSFVEFGASATLPTGDLELFGVQADLGGAWIPVDGAISPYFGAALGPRLFAYDLDGGFGVGGYANVGVLFARTASFRPYVEIHAGGDFLGENPRLHPNVGVFAGIGF